MLEVLGCKLKYDDILFYDLEYIDKKNSMISINNAGKFILHITLKNNGVLTFSSKSNDYDLLEKKNELDEYFMGKEEYKNLNLIYEKIGRSVIMTCKEKKIMMNKSNKDYILEELYKINKSILSKKISIPEIPIDNFDYYYDSSYRFSTYNSACDACSNRRDRMERESVDFFDSYQKKINDNLKSYTQELIDLYLLNINDFLKNNLLNSNDDLMSIVLDSCHIININITSLSLNQKNKIILQNFLDDIIPKTNAKSIHIGFNDYEIDDNGKTLLSKAYRYVIYKNNVQSSLKKIGKEYQKTIYNQDIVNYILCTFIESLTYWIKNRL